jgi:hypothetical protein
MIQLALGFLSVAGMTLALCGPAYAQVYKWTDEKGEIHYSDSSSGLKDTKGKGSLLIPAKKAAKEPEPEPNAQEPAVQPTTQDTAQEKQADGQPAPLQAVSDPNVVEQSAPEKKEATKAPAKQEPPAKQVKMSKRVLKTQKVEKDKSGSEKTSTPTAP